MPDPDALALARGHLSRATRLLEILEQSGVQQTYLPIERITELMARATAEATTGRGWAALAEAERKADPPPIVYRLAHQPTVTPPGDSAAPADTEH